MKCLDFDWQINEFMIYCRSTQLRERTMYSYEQTLRLFERWCADELKIYSVDKVTENVIRKYINDLQERGKYMDDRTICLPAENTKGRKTRFVFFSVKTAKALQRWLRYKDRYTKIYRQVEAMTGISKSTLIRAKKV